MSRLTIETRLNLLIGALLVLALAANMLAIVLSAGPRIRAESESMANLAILTIERALAEMQASSNPQRDLAGLVERMSSIRHVHVFLEGARPSELVDVRAPSKGGMAGRRKGWLETLTHGSAKIVSVPAIIGGVDFGKLIVVSDPSDELEEIGNSLIETATGGLTLIAAVFALTRAAVRHALKPIATLSSALSKLQDGDFSVRLATDGPPDFGGISANVNELAATLSRTREENLRLAQELVSLEDQERRELAAELHDEFGPYLFAIRASATSLLAEAEQDPHPSASRRAKLSRAMLQHTEALQKVNRRVLQRLRPPALAEIGLEGALQGLVAQWRETNPSVLIGATLSLPNSPLDETTELTIYRVVQEGLTNAFRHAGASRIDVAVSSSGEDSLTVCVTDDGSGDARDLTPGFGLSSMRDRVLALGGTLEFNTRTPSGGLSLVIGLPIRAAVAAQESGREYSVDRI